MSKTPSHLLHTISPLDLKLLSHGEKLALLQEYRNTRTRHADAVLLLATDILAGGSGGLSSGELYEVYEQVVTASLNCGKISNAQIYLNLLEKRFGRGSMRVKHLRGLCLEAEGHEAEAKKLYELMRKEMPTNDFPVKRLVAMLKAAGDFQGAIRVLEEELVYVDEDEQKHTFLEVHRGDAQMTYRELSQLHYLTGNLDRAIWYAEESLLFDQDSYLTHVRLAELLYMKKDVGRAMIEYSQSLLLNREPNNSRAAYGLWHVCCDQLKMHQSGVHKLDEDEERRIRDLRDMSADVLRGMYRGCPTLSALEAVLRRA